MAEYSVIGKSIPRVDALGKVTGEAVYSTDLYLPGILVGKIKRSPYPFARILSININKASKLPGVKAVITAQNVVQFPFGIAIKDELPLADTYVRYAGEAVAAVAAIDADTADEALDLIEVEYEELRPILHPEEAMKTGARAIHPERAQVKQNTAYQIEIIRGGGEAAFKQADVIVEERFFTQAQHQTPLEPQACIAQWDISGRLTIWVGTQRAHKNGEILAGAIGIPEHKVRVIQPYMGGSFGAKWHMHPYFPIAALLAKVAGKPVKIVYTREEDFISSHRRATEVITIRLGFKKDGTMVAKKVTTIADAGAYEGGILNLVRVSHVRADSIYRIPNIKVTCKAVYTNTSPYSMFRGPGDPQMLFALETLIDMASEKLGIDPIEIRLKNAAQKGDITPSGFILNSCAFSDTLRQVRQKSGWVNKKKNNSENCSKYKY